MNYKTKLTVSIPLEVLALGLLRIHRVVQRMPVAKRLLRDLLLMLDVLVEVLVLKRQSETNIFNLCLAFS